MFREYYKNRRVFVTGHTGFKGSWLIAWLLKLGSEVCGYSLGIPTNPSNFKILGLERDITHIKGDICDRSKLQKAILKFKPDIVFHLAAQSLVRWSYNNPAETFETNAIGTMNILECIRQSPSVEAGVIITTDKCYRNLGRPHDYKENDKLGGEDPYSSSKGCAELIVYSYFKSFFKNGPRIASARAGNVIGGGDWAEDRIVPDAVRAWSDKKPLIIRNPRATRPWQHVLEPLSGYLWLGAELCKENSPVVGEAFNFGPTTSANHSVQQLISHMAEYWPGTKWELGKVGMFKEKEALFLQLCCNKARRLLNWKAILPFENMTTMTIEWYQNYYKHGKTGMLDFTNRQIDYYSSMARKSRLPWVSL